MSIMIDDNGPFVLLTLNRPPLNTLTLEAVLELGAFFKAHDGDKPLIMTGAAKAFSAGVDTKAFMSYTDDQRRDLFRAITDMTAALYSIASPVIAAVNGHALGGGLVLALCADYRIAVDGDHSFGLTEAKAGVPFPAGPAEIIREDLPAGLLRHLTLSSSVVSARFLHEHLVFDELVAQEDLESRAAACANALAAQPAFAAVKEQVRGALKQRLIALAWRS